METRALRTLPRRARRCGGRMWFIARFRASLNRQDPGSHQCWGGAGTPPAAWGQEGLRPGKRGIWVEPDSQTFWRGVEVGGGIKSSITDAHRWKELEAHSSTMAGGPLDSQGGRVGGEEEKAVEDRTVSMGWNISPWTTRQVFCLKVKSL